MCLVAAEWQDLAGALDLRGVDADVEASEWRCMGAKAAGVYDVGTGELC